MIREVKRFDAQTSRTSNALLEQYWSGDPFLRPFYKHIPHWGSFDSALHNRDRFSTDRETLVRVLAIQHQAYTEQYPLVKANIDGLLRSDCYTVTTGHQLCLATGPMFFLYKIVTAINLSKELAKRYPGKHFVPVYWMASEDHDIAEIDHFQVDGQVIRSGTTWEGPSGRQSVEELDPVWDELQKVLDGKPYMEQVIGSLRLAFCSAENLAEATRKLVLELFGDQGLLVIDADRPEFKRLFGSIVRQELFGGTTKPLVEEVIGRMQDRHKPQAHVRELNLFYLQDRSRNRIVKSEDGFFRVLDSELVFSAEELEKLLEDHPECFSPNVILRPLFQEAILPNVATVGGPAEVSYWMLLLPLFDFHGIPYPILVPRNQALIIHSRVLDKFTKQGFSMEELFQPPDELTSRWLARHEHLQPSIEDGRKELRQLFDRINGLLSGIDSTLESSVKAEAQRSLNGLDQLEKKGTAALKRRHELVLTQIHNLSDRVNPNGSPQERVENFSGFAAEYGTNVFVQTLLDNLLPLDPRFTVLVTE